MNTLDGLIRDGLPASVLLGNTLGSQKVLKEIWIAIRNDGLPGATVIGDGTRDNPYDGSTAVKFDSIMSVLLGGVPPGTQTIIHLGPGLFRTRGGDGNSQSLGAWAPQSGQKLIGSGMFATTLLLTVNPAVTAPSGVFGAYVISVRNPDGIPNYLDGFEVCDLTLDCGMDDQPLPPDATHTWPAIMCGGIAVAGKNIAVRRVRFINFGTRGSVVLDGEGAKSLESYPASFFGGQYEYPANTSFNQVIEDCIFESNVGGAVQ